MFSVRRLHWNSPQTIPIFVIHLFSPYTVKDFALGWTHFSYCSHCNPTTVKSHSHRGCSARTLAPNARMRLPNLRVTATPALKVDSIQHKIFNSIVFILLKLWNELPKLSLKWNDPLWRAPVFHPPYLNRKIFASSHF